VAGVGLSERTPLSNVEARREGNGSGEWSGRVGVKVGSGGSEDSLLAQHRESCILVRVAGVERIARAGGEPPVQLVLGLLADVSALRERAVVGWPGASFPGSSFPATVLS